MNSHPISDEEAVAAADKEMEARANRAKEILSQRYVGLKRQQVRCLGINSPLAAVPSTTRRLTIVLHVLSWPLLQSSQEDRKNRKMQLERQMVGMPEEKKQILRRSLEHEEMLAQKESRRKVSPSDFESLAIIGRGAFGEVRLVRHTSKSKANEERIQIFALKSMKKEMMVLKNQVGHVRAEREALAKADADNKWLTALHYSFTDKTHLYMVMEFLPGGDLMSLLIKEDTFSEPVTRFFMAEAAHAISSVHALGYIHRDIKPDNMLLDARGHLKLTDLGLCKKVGEVSPMDDPEYILKMMREQGLIAESTGVEAGGSKPGTPVQGKHRDSSDAMAMSIDDGIPNAQGRPQAPAPKARREVSYSVGQCFTFVPAMEREWLVLTLCLFVAFRWRIRLSEHPTILLPRFWQPKMEPPVIRTRRLSIGGRWVSSCLNVWLVTPPFTQKTPSPLVGKSCVGDNVWSCPRMSRPICPPSALIF